MNTKLDTLLTSLSDQELAAFYTYRFSEFIKSSKERILSELDCRSLSISDLAGLLAEAEKNKAANGCPRCGSLRSYISRETETVNYSYASVDHQVDYRICIVCSYSADKVEAAKQAPVISGFGLIRFLMNRRK